MLLCLKGENNLTKVSSQIISLRPEGPVEAALFSRAAPLLWFSHRCSFLFHDRICCCTKALKTWNSQLNIITCSVPLGKPHRKQTVYISHLWGGCTSWKQCRIFPSLYSERRIKNKNPSHTITQNKQKKNVVSNIETLSFMLNMHVGELSQSLWTIWPKAA